MKMERKVLCWASMLVLFGQVLGKPVEGEDERFAMFQGDMLLSKDEIKLAAESKDLDAELRFVDPSGAVALPGVATVTRKKWPNGVVPFVISSEVRRSLWKLFGRKSGTERAIRSAMRDWEQATCIKFKDRTNEHDYVEFINGGFGMCYSHVGRIGGRQVLSLGMGCRSSGIALHEIGHALGLHHEQSRPDRDRFVKIEWDNIKSGMENNFQSYSVSKINTLGTAYNYGSIMHYADNAFAKWPWQKTIKPLKKGVSIGQRKKLSQGDIETINRFYNCRSK